MLTHKPHRFLQQSYLWPRRVLPATRVTVSMATFLIIRFALTATVSVINFLGLAICTADFGTVYFQGTISQAALGCALTLTSHMPPASRVTGQILVSIFLNDQVQKDWLVDIGAKGCLNWQYKPEFTFSVAGLSDDSRSSCTVTPLVWHHHPVWLSATENLPLAFSYEDTMFGQQVNLQSQKFIL